MLPSESSSFLTNKSNVPAFEDQQGCLESSELTCCHQLLGAGRIINNRLWAEYKKSEENLAGADLYATVMLGLFAFIIILLMLRSIKSKESLDEQVAILLTSMQLRVEHDEMARKRKSMREAKRKAQLWLNEIRSKSLSRVTRKQRSASFYTVRSRSRETSASSVPTRHERGFRSKMPMRARSYNGVLPSIVVCDEVVPNPLLSASRSASRPSSLFSDVQSVYSTDQDLVFQFPPLHSNPA